MRRPVMHRKLFMTITSVHEEVEKPEAPGALLVGTYSGAATEENSLAVF